MAFERIWIETQRDGRIFACTRMFNGGGSAYTRVLGQLDAGPAIGTRWEYVRTDAIDTEAGALAAAKTEIDRLKAELAEARKMPECVERLLRSMSAPSSVGPWETLRDHIAAVRRHYAPPLTISVGEWRLTDGSICRVFSDGKQFLARRCGTMFEVSPDGQLDGRGVWLVERIGD